MLLLDALAARYHTDPWSVLDWSPERLTFNAMCLDQAKATASQTIKRVGGAFPVVVVGGG